MTKTEQLLRIRRAVFELEQAVINILADSKADGELQNQSPHEYGLEPNQIATKMGLLLAPGPHYGDSRCSLVWGILDNLLIEGRVEKLESRAVLKDDVT